ncbi:MAG: hypothetical protein NTY53_08125, partial [Kiritimatiellaeota bacterium]|nr:hypothetical protein [Kiritimatiellota bacterium]
LLDMTLYAAVFTSVLFTASLVGLWFFWNPARILFLISSALLICMICPVGSTGNYWWSIPLGSISWLVTIAIIILMFVPPIRDFFGSTKKDSSQPPDFNCQAKNEKVSSVVRGRASVSLRFLLILALALVVESFVVFFIDHRYIQSVRNELYKDAEEIEIIAAADNLVQGAELKFEDIGVIRIYRKRGGYTKHYVQKKDANLILGHKLRYDLERRQPILWVDVDLPGDIRNTPQPPISISVK